MKYVDSREEGISAVNNDLDSIEDKLIRSGIPILRNGHITIPEYGMPKHSALLIYVIEYLEPFLNLSFKLDCEALRSISPEKWPGDLKLKLMYNSERLNDRQLLEEYPKFHGLYIDESSIRNAGEGAFAVKLLPFESNV